MAEAAAAANQRAGLIAKSPEAYKLKFNYQSWLKQFRNYVELLNVPDNNIYRTFLSFLDEETFGIVEALNLPDAQRADFFANEAQVPIREAIKNRQGQRIPAEYMLRFRKQREGETIERYAAELEKMAQEAFPDDQDIRANRQLIQSFLMGVRNDELGVKLLEENFDNLTAAVNAAARHCKALQTRRYIRKESEGQVLEKVYQTSCKNCTSVGNNTDEHAVNLASAAVHQHVSPQKVENANQIVPNEYWSAGYQTRPPMQRPPNQMQPQYQDGYLQYQNQFNAPNYYRGFAQQGPRNRQYQDKRNIQCYHCLKFGHYKSECWMLKNKNDQRSNQQLATRPKPYCSYCSKQGHTVQNCWHLNKPNQSAPIQQAAQERSAQNKTGNTNPFRTL